MMELRCSAFIIVLQIYESVSLSREKIEEQLSNVFVPKCSFKTTEIGYLAEYGVCKVPSFILNGRLLFVDGLKEGSKAKFICDDYHFTNISHGVCRADGTWEGLEHPCVLVTRSPYELQSKGRITPGSCVVMLATAKRGIDWPNINLTTQNMETVILHISLRFNEKSVVFNTFSNAVWGTEERSPYFPLHYDQESNMTLCVEHEVYRCYADGKELFTYKHRLQPTLVKVLKINYFIVRSLTFKEGNEY